MTKNDPKLHRPSKTITQTPPTKKDIPLAGDVQFDLLSFFVLHGCAVKGRTQRDERPREALRIDAGIPGFFQACDLRKFRAWKNEALEEFHAVLVSSFGDIYQLFVVGGYSFSLWGVFQVCSLYILK